MTHFYNPVTNEYPRHQGDLELLGWKVGEPLPENWVEVVDAPAVDYDIASEMMDTLLPQNIDGEWHAQFVIRPKTIEEKEVYENSKNRPKIEFDSSVVEILDISNLPTDTINP